MHRHDLLHELDVAHEPGLVVGHQLDRRHCSDAARVQRGRVDVTAFHQAEHLARPPAHDERFAIELAGERVEGPHDVGDGAVSVRVRIRRLRVLRLVQDLRIGLRHHLLAVVDPDQVLLEDVVIEHVLGGFAEVDQPLAEMRRLYSVRHVLAVTRTGGVVVTADSANAAGNEMSVARVFALHEDRVAPEDRRRAVAFHHFTVLEIDLRIDSETAHDPGDRVPGHLYEIARVSLVRRLRDDRCHQLPLNFELSRVTRFGWRRSRACRPCAASAAPCRRCAR